MSLVKSSFFVSILSLLISVISFLNQVFIANYFGTGLEMDNYLVIGSFSVMLSGIISSSLSFSLVPHLINKKKSLLKEEYLLFFISLRQTIFKIISILAIVGIIFSFFYLNFIHKLDNNSITLLILFWILFIFNIILTVHYCFFNAEEVFSLPLILTSFQFIFSISLIYLLNEYLGVKSIVGGMLFGNLLALLYSLYKGRKNGLVVRKKNFIFEEDIQCYIKYLRFALLAMLAFSSFQFVDSYWTSHLKESSMSYLGYSQRLLISLGSLIIIGPSTVLIPRLTIAVKEKRFKDYYNDSVLILKLVFALTSLVAIVVGVFSSEIISLLFERGAFDKASTIGVSSVLKIMLIGMVFMLCVVVAYRILFANNKDKTCSLIGVYTIVAYFILSGLLIIKFDVLGIALSYTFTWIVIFGITLFFLFKGKNVLNTKLNKLFLFKQAVVLLIILFTGIVIKNLFIKSLDISFLSKGFFYLSFSGFSLIILYFILSLKVFKMNEIIFFINKIKR